MRCAGLSALAELLVNDEILI